MRMMPQQAASSPRCASGGTDSSRMGQRTATLPTPACKSVLLVKLDRQEAAQAMFSGTGVTITTDGCRHLGSALGSQQFVREFMASKVTIWLQELCNLSEIARSQPQAAYSALVHGLQHKWSFLCPVLQVTLDHLWRCYTRILFEIRSRTRWWCLKCVRVYPA